MYQIPESGPGIRYQRVVRVSDTRKLSRYQIPESGPGIRYQRVVQVSDSARVTRNEEAGQRGGPGVCACVWGGGFDVFISAALGPKA